MGSRIARRLADHGHDVVVWNRTPEKASGLGFPVAESPADAARRAEVVITMVTDPNALVDVGELGSGAAAKLVANSTLFGAIAVVGEAIGLADALGLSREAAFDVLAVSPVAAQAERRRPAIESGEYPPRFALRLARKDADLIADAVDADLRVAEAARSWLVDADDAGDGDEDYSVVVPRILGER